MPNFSIHIDTRPIQQKLDRLAAGTRPPVILKVIAAYMRQSIAKTFSTQGTGEAQWAPLAASTIRSRRNRDKGSIKILQDTGRLKNSIQYQVEASSLVIGTNLVYAAPQQFGTRGGPGIKIGTFSSISAVNVRSRGSKGALGRVQGRGRGRGGAIPARPFVVFRPEDEANINDRVQFTIDSLISKLFGGGA